ncbi:hypothetical protein UT300018_32570 [Clostridium faecium]
MKTCHCPEMSRDTNGLADTIELRFYLMWLRFTLRLTELKLNELRVCCINTFYWNLKFECSNLFTRVVKRFLI